MSTTSAPATTLEERLAIVRDRIADAERRSGRQPGSVTLVGVSKTVTRTEVDEAYAAGLRHYGENRVQNALRTFEGDLPDDLVLHLIGTLQTNKARFVPGNFDIVHSLDRDGLVTELDRRCRAAGVRLPVLIQVNIAREEQKHGCQTEELPQLIETTLACDALELRGLMTMAPLGSDAETARPIFIGLREVRDQMRERYPEANLGELSMGMTNDYVAAIEEGATIVRVGRAIFAEPAAR